MACLPLSCCRPPPPCQFPTTQSNTLDVTGQVFVARRSHPWSSHPGPTARQACQPVRPPFKPSPPKRHPLKELLVRHSSYIIPPDQRESCQCPLLYKTTFQIFPQDRLTSSYSSLPHSPTSHKTVMSAPISQSDHFSEAISSSVLPTPSQIQDSSDDIQLACHTSFHIPPGPQQTPKHLLLSQSSYHDTASHKTTQQATFRS